MMICRRGLTNCEAFRVRECLADLLAKTISTLTDMTPNTSVESQRSASAAQLRR